MLTGYIEDIPAASHGPLIFHSSFYLQIATCLPNI